jgi:DtxR family Mn-dependent transcriptional regulator
MKDVWKKYDETELTHSSVHHLLAVNTLIRENGYARSVDIANHLNISRASVSITVNKLKDKGFIAEDKNRFLHLSQRGNNIVNSVLSKRRIIELFFTKFLDLPQEEAEINACKIEHLLSEPAGKKLISLLGYFLSNHIEANRFRQGFKDFNYICSSTDDCQVCQLDCYLNRPGRTLNEGST